jgi:hypothetical protein
MISVKKTVFLILISIIIIACGEEVVEPTSGTIEGTIYNFLSGDVIGNASIVTTPPSSSVTSDTLTGTFKILHVDPGVYRVHAERIGYDSSGVNISVIVDEMTTADIALKLDTTYVDTTQAP